MTEIEKKLPWDENNWIKEVSSWVRKSLSAHSIAQVGTLSLVHSAAWSVVYRVPTSKGFYYFKSLCPALKHEPALTQQLASWQSNFIQPVLEIENSQGWMLMPEGGSTLRQILENNLTLNYWKKILPAYARFQQTMIPYRQELLALGVKDRRLQILPGLAAEMAKDRQSLCIAQPNGLSAVEYGKLIASMPKLKKLCEELAQYNIPESLQHDDFHDGNIFVVQDGFRLFDWAESFIAHPFFTLVVTMRSIAYRFELEENSHQLRELEDAYLMEWQEYASLRKLREALDLTMTIGRINRALTWHMVVSSLPEPYRSKEAEAVSGWVQLFLERITLSA